MCYLSWLFTDNINNDSSDLLSDDDLDNIDVDDVSFVSVDDDNPNSINVDIGNGFPFGNENFIVVHYNINSITAPGRLENLNHCCKYCNHVNCWQIKKSRIMETNDLTFNYSSMQKRIVVASAYQYII